jgi:hypothetical protein
VIELGFRDVREVQFKTCETLPKVDLGTCQWEEKNSQISEEFSENSHWRSNQIQEEAIREREKVRGDYSKTRSGRIMSVA